MRTLAARYHDFHAPEATIAVDGRKLSAQGINFADLRVEMVLDGANSFSFTVPDALDVEYNPKYAEILRFGNRVEIAMGYQGDLYPVMTGLISSVTWNFSEGNYLDVTVEGYDYLFLLMKNERQRSWNDRTDSEIVSTVLQPYPFREITTDDTRVRHPYTLQEQESDYAFVRRLAARNGFEVLAEGEAFSFREPPVERQAAFSLAYGREILTFNPNLNISRQVSRVEVIGWDPERKERIVGIAGREDEARIAGDGVSAAEAVRSMMREEVVHRVTLPVYTQEDADNRARAILNELASGLISGSGKAIGIPELKPGQIVALTNLGNAFSRNYYLQRVTHDLGREGYSISFTVKGNTYHESA